MTVGRSQSPTHQTGAWGEHLALKTLVAAGYQLVLPNYHSRYGEIDLIVQKDLTLVFVEVKVRKQGTFGSAVDAVNFKKQQKLCKTASFFLAQYPQYADYACRFDVIAITNQLNSSDTIDWIEGAFVCEG